MSKQAKVLIPVNVNHLGAHNELMPTNPPTEMMRVYKYHSKPLKVQRVWVDPDINIAKDTPLWPPYQNFPDDLDRVQGSVETGFNNKLIL